MLNSLNLIITVAMKKNTFVLENFMPKYSEGKEHHGCSFLTNGLEKLITLYRQADRKTVTTYVTKY